MRTVFFPRLKRLQPLTILDFFLFLLIKLLMNYVPRDDNSPKIGEKHEK